jgi:small subunit ribosomal protein S24e
MDFNKLEKKENPLLERKEIRFEVSYAGVTPSFEEVRKELVGKLNSDEKLTVLDSVHQQYGEHKAKGYAKVYDNEKALKVELEHKLLKNFEPEKRKAATKKKEEKKAEPAKKEEAKASAPKEEKNAEPAKKEKKEE